MIIRVLEDFAIERTSEHFKCSGNRNRQHTKAGSGRGAVQPIPFQAQTYCAMIILERGSLIHGAQPLPKTTERRRLPRCIARAEVASHTVSEKNLSPAGATTSN